MAAQERDRGIPIRSISRALAVLQAVNRGRSLTMMEIAHASGVPYPTACRIVQTLLHEGMIEREATRKRYQPTALVETLAHGFQGHGALVRVARPHMAQLTRDFGWPLSLTTHVGSSMVLRESTHAQTSLTFNAYFQGFAMPILDCAAGLVYLAYADPTERDGILDTLRYKTDPETRHMLKFTREGRLLHDIRDAGYAARVFNRFTQNPGKTSSLATPIFDKEKITGALTVAFFSAALTMEAAVEQLLPKLKATSDAISKDLSEGKGEIVEASDS